MRKNRRFECQRRKPHVFPINGMAIAASLETRVQSGPQSENRIRNMRRNASLPHRQWNQRGLSSPISSAWSELAIASGFGAELVNTPASLRLRPRHSASRSLCPS